MIEYMYKYYFLPSYHQRILDNRIFHQMQTKNGTFFDRKINKIATYRMDKEMMMFVVYNLSESFNKFICGVNSNLVSSA